MKKTICLALAVILCVGIVFGFALSVSEPAVAASNQEKLEEAKKNLEAARNEIKDIKNRLAELGNNKQELMAKKNLLDEQIEATEAQIALINSALEVIEKELEEKGAELAVVQDKYDATMVKFRARARASYEAGNQSYLEAILTATDLSQLITKLDLVEAVAEYDSKLLNDLSEQAKSIKVLYDEIEDRKNMKQSELEEQAEAEAELISKKSELQTTLTTLMADEEELEAQEQALMAMFVGTTSVSTDVATFQLTPDGDISNMVIARISPLNGIVDASDLSGDPVYLDLKVTRKGEMPVNEKGVQLPMPKGGVPYCIPGEAQVTVSCDGEVFAERDEEMSQFGVVYGLAPNSFTDRKAPIYVIYNPATGAISAQGPANVSE